MDRLYLLDASNYLYRSYFALPEMTNGAGESTHALFGFVRSLLKLIKDFRPEYLAVVFDGPSGSSHRRSLYADYKAHRKETPKDLIAQIPQAQQFCRLMGIAELMIPNIEADDTMGSVAKWAAAEGSTVYLCTGDKDLCQLVAPNIFLLNTFKDNAIMGPEEVEKQFGVTPSQMVDFLAITGDASDNVPGLPGFGPKTAADLLRRFGSLESLLDRAEELPRNKKKETLIRERNQVLLSQKLVALNTEAPFPREAAFFKRGAPAVAELRAFYHCMNFSSLLAEAEAVPQNPSTHEPGARPPAYHLVDDLSTLRTLIEYLGHQKRICLDTETTSVHPMEAELVGIGLGVHPREAWYLPLNGTLPPKTALEELKPLFENPGIGFYGHNLKYDYHLLLNYGIKIACLCFDTMLASYLLNAHSRQHSLDYLSLQIFGKVKTPIESLIGKGKKQISMLQAPLESVSDYCCEDVDYTIRLQEVFCPLLQERELNSIFYELELPLLPVLAKMERHGMFIDTLHFQRLSIELGREIERLKQEMHTLAGRTFNPNSPKQTAEVLFDALGIRPSTGRAPNRSVGADVLEQLRGTHPIIATLLEYRTLEKLHSTYVDALPKAVNPSTHRIHATFNQSVAATGRLSCQDPNLQNIPVRTEMGRRIREGFKPQRPGWSYLSADYSQIELRLLAHLSSDPVLIRSFLAHEDIHAATASHIFQVPIDEISTEQRQAAKTVNFGIMYGQQPFSLSQQLGVEPKMAALFIRSYFERYPAVKTFLEESKAKALRTGKTVTLLGRERLIPEIASSNAHIRAMGERLAVNTPIQGTQADLIKKAMLEIDNKLAKRGLKAYMILQIHDELLFEAPDDELEELSQLVRDTMTRAATLKIPLIVDIHIGKNWKEC